MEKASPQIPGTYRGAEHFHHHFTDGEGEIRKQSRALHVFKTCLVILKQAQNPKTTC